MDREQMTEEQKLYFFYGYVYCKAQQLQEEFGNGTIKDYIQELLDGVVKKKWK